MEGTAEREFGALGGLFQQIITDMKNGTPLWEDLIAKANKLQICLRATIQAIAAYLDAFQKIADAATNTRGATKDIGTALTRICLRHRAVETKMKTFTSAIMDCLIAPLQEKLEDWKKSVMNLDKEHAKDYKKARAELKKRSTDTLRLQKKVRKGSGSRTDDLNKALQQVTEKKELLQETERNAVRAALIEERSRYCIFVTFLKPVVEEEISMLSELSHLQEVMEQLEKHTTDPYSLPLASEQVLSDLKGTEGSWALHSPPPSSPSSLGSRKSSMCSISSLTSTSSSSSKSHSSPSHLYWNRSISQNHHFPALSSTCIGSNRCLGSISSQDSGFTSQDTLYARNSTASYFKQQVSDMAEEDLNNESSVIPTSTWPNLQDTLQFEKAATAIINDRPHTISSAYEKGHTRPALSVYTFQSPAESNNANIHKDNSPNSESTGDTTPIAYPQPSHGTPTTEANVDQMQMEMYCRPPLPERHLSSDAVPRIPDKTTFYTPVTYKNNPKEESNHATYANLYELSNKGPHHYHSTTDKNNEKVECTEKESSASESSLESSSGYGSQSGISGATPTPEHDPNDTVPSCSVKSTAHYINQHYNTDSSRLSTISSNGYCTIKSGTLSRRGSVQSQKPPPPVRRSSSILNARIEHNSLENLPPPPAFLLDCGNTSDINKSVTSCIAAEIQKINSLETYTDRDSVRKNSGLYASSSFKDDCDAERKGGDVERKGISVAETVRTLTEMNHQPASPVSVRRTASSCSRSISMERKQESSAGIIAALSARIAPNSSPRHGRKEGKTVNRANRVRQWIALRTVADPTVCHGSLMDQIKRGTLLKPTGVMNDTSSPKTY